MARATIMMLVFPLVSLFLFARRQDSPLIFILVLEEKQNRKHGAIFGLGRVLSLIQCRGAGYIDFAQVRVAEVIES